MGYPVQLVHLEGRRVLLAGAGAIAAGKVEALLTAKAAVHLVAPVVGPEMQPHLHRIACWECREVEDRDVVGAAVVIAATDDREVNRRLAAAAMAAGVLVNAVDDPDACDFYVPAVVRRGPVTLAISTDGGSPLFAARLRRVLEAALPESLGEVAGLFKSAREKGLRGLAKRGRILAALADPGLGALIDRGEDGSDRLIEIASKAEEPFDPGTVSIVGAGPGGRGLLTVRALDRLHRADVVLHDALVDPEILAEVLPGTRVIDVGRRGPCVPKLEDGAFPQSMTIALMIREARAGRRVVRLHAGDPFVFGRGGEETDALLAANVGFERVPGISAALSAAVAAGVPVTQRGISRGFTVRTGHTQEGYSEAELPLSEETVVVLMGLGATAQICASLVAEGRPATTPAMAVSAAWRSEQRVVEGTLADLAQRVAAAELSAPVTLVVGDIVGKRSATALRGEVAA